MKYNLKISKCALYDYRFDIHNNTMVAGTKFSVLDLQTNRQTWKNTRASLVTRVRLFIGNSLIAAIQQQT